MDIDQYSTEHPNRDVQEKILDDELLTLFRNKPLNILEIGCGDGGLALAVLKKFNFVKSYYAYDISQIRLDRLNNTGESYVQSGQLITISNLSEINFENFPGFDLIVSEQVIEHVVDELAFLKDIYGVSNGKSIVYLSTVFITLPGYYFYKNDAGERVLDPTHIREYRDKELLEKIRGLGFMVIAESRNKIYYPLSSFLSKILIKFLKFNYRTSSKWWIRLPGYYNWRIILKKHDKV